MLRDLNEFAWIEFEPWVWTGPDALVEHFEDAGHRLQGDMPLELAPSIERFDFG